MLNRTYLSVIGGLLSLLLFVSCSDNPSSFSDSPPELPPAKSMQMDFSSFDSPQRKARTLSGGYYNFSKASGMTFMLNRIAGDNLDKSFTLYEAADQAEPEFNDDGNWVWSYSRSADGKNYAIKLKASRMSGQDVNWNLYVSNPEEGLSNHLLFSGKANTEGTKGSWDLYNMDDTESKDPGSQVVWELANNDQADLRLNVLSNDSSEGDYIEYSYDGQIKNVVYFDSRKSITTEMQINTETQQGYILADDYNDGKKACWDKDLQDTPCDGEAE